MDSQQDFRIVINTTKPQTSPELPDQGSRRTSPLKISQNSAPGRSTDSVLPTQQSPWYPMPTSWQPKERGARTNVPSRVRHTPTTEMLPADLGWLDAFPYPASNVPNNGESDRPTSQPRTERASSQMPTSFPPTSRPLTANENATLLDLRDNRRMSWTQVAGAMSSVYYRNYDTSALQQQYGRLQRQSHQVRSWTLSDTSALHSAMNVCGSAGFQAVSEQMRRLGATETWTAEECRLAWQQLIDAMLAPTRDR